MNSGATASGPSVCHSHATVNHIQRDYFGPMLVPSQSGWNWWAPISSGKVFQWVNPLWSWPPCSYSHSFLEFHSILVIKHHDQKQLGEESVYFNLFYHMTAHHPGKSEQAYAAGTTEEYCLVAQFRMTFSAAFLYHPASPDQQWHRPQQTQPSYLKHQSRKWFTGDSLCHLIRTFFLFQNDTRLYQIDMLISNAIQLFYKYHCFLLPCGQPAFLSV